MKALGQLPRQRLVIALMLLFTMSAVGQDAAKAPSPAAPSQDDATQALQKATQKPVANLISVPLQNNTNFDIGPFDRTQNVLNIQPVIPIGINEKWNMIIRWITPVIWQPAPGTANLDLCHRRKHTSISVCSSRAEQCGSVRVRRHEPHLLPLSRQAAQTDLGCRALVRSANRHEQSPRARKIQHGTILRGATAAWPLDRWCIDQQRLVGGGFGQSA